MDKLKLKLEHCYGIRKLDVVLDFARNAAIAIYAPNGSMKSSLACTLQDIADSVARLPAGTALPEQKVRKLVDATLRTVIGLNCLNSHTLDIDLGNGHVLSCSLKKAIGPTNI